MGVKAMGKYVRQMRTILGIVSDVGKEMGKIVGMAAVAVALLVGLLALMPLRPELEVSPTEALAKDQPFSTPFRVTAQMLALEK